MLLRKLRYRVILQYKKYTIFRKLIVPCAIFKILLLIVAAPSFLCTFRIAQRILGTKKPRSSTGSAAWQCNHSYHDMQIFTYVKYFLAPRSIGSGIRGSATLHTTSGGDFRGFFLPISDVFSRRCFVLLHERHQLCGLFLFPQILNPNFFSISSLDIATFPQRGQVCFLSQPLFNNQINRRINGLIS